MKQGTRGISDKEFVEQFQELGCTQMAEKYDIKPTNVYARRRRIEEKTGVPIISPNQTIQRVAPETRSRQPYKIKDGYVVVFSDCHYWPDVLTTAHLALVEVCDRVQPKAVIANGDVFDGASISRHPPLGWERTPSVEEELQACQRRLAEVREVTPDSRHFWPIGNHDARFETKLATVAPTFEGVKGTSLKDHFAGWTPCDSVGINMDNTGKGVIVKHNWKGGEHAAYNNVVKGGVNMVTSHTHRLLSRSYMDYTHIRRWGVETGTLAEPYGPQFAYSRDNPRDWTSGFIVLEFEAGQLKEPALVQVISEGVYEFDRKRYSV